MAEKYDVGIIGAGIVGLAAARAIVQRYPQLRLAVIEREQLPAQHQTGRNSGVVHSGIYYKPGSVKAETCVRGAQALARFCDEQGLPFERCGKVIIATAEHEKPYIYQLFEQGTANGVKGMALLRGEDGIRAIEPRAVGLVGLHVPSAAIVDYAGIARRLAQLLAGGGVRFHYGASVKTLQYRGNQWIIETSRATVTAAAIVVCAGIEGDRLMRLAGERPGLRLLPIRGEYYELTQQKRGWIRGLIYPVPNPRTPFLGVHLTRHIDGSVSAGPNAVLALSRYGYGKYAFDAADTAEMFLSPAFWRFVRRYAAIGYDEAVRSLFKRKFVRDVQRLLPDVSAADLLPSQCGIRAQAIDFQGRLVDDFHFEYRHRALFALNMPSPAATACLAIAERVADGSEGILSTVRHVSIAT
jgi:L-2-hydroxyglutarate oxidase LhgO